jgi:sterol desaturase/sphingolipid hydroxylase (fatty acid hydroxylase superfamily)
MLEPDMSWLEIVTLALLPAFLLLDLLHRAHADRRSRGWRTRALVVTAFNFGLSLVLGGWWVELFGGRSLFDGSVLGTAGGAMVGVLVYELVHYAYHRAAHRFGWLWRLGHQMHHSAESLDAFGAYYLHPLDAGLFITWSALVLYPVLGLTPESGALAAAALTFFAVFQHADIRTPRWLGYLVQRPESHRIHHARGVHAHNYSDLPLWDMVFGTFRNPAAAEAGVAQGFYDGASRRVPEMLAMRDVSVARSVQSSSAGT